MYRKCDYDQKRKLALKTEVLLRQNISNMKKNIDIQKRCGKGENFLSFEPVGERFNFTYAKAITGFVEGWSQDLVPNPSRACSTFVEEIR